MYACPKDCGSTVFVQLVKQQETVHTTEDGEPTQFEQNGDPVVTDLQCAECGAEVEDR